CSAALRMAVSAWPSSGVKGRRTYKNSPPQRLTCACEWLRIITRAQKPEQTGRTIMNRREFLKSLAVPCPAAVPASESRAAQNSPASAPSTSSKMPQRALGKTGVTVSALGLGGVIGMQLAPSSDHDPVAIAETALNLGITYFDTSPDYNNGQS